MKFRRHRPTHGQWTTHATEPQRAAQEKFSREAAAAREAPAVIHLGPPSDELDNAAEKATGIGSRFIAIADFIAPAPPPTKEQAEGMQRAARRS
jgi:hypothetical protein